MILCKIEIVYQSIGDVENAIKVLNKVISIVKENVREIHICMAVVLCVLRDLYTNKGMITESKDVLSEFRDSYFIFLQPGISVGFPC